VLIFLVLNFPVLNFPCSSFLVLNFHQPLDTPSTILQETTEEFFTGNVGIGEVQSPTQEVIENTTDDKYSVYSNIQPATITFHKAEKNEKKREKLADLSHTNIQLQHLQEAFAAELAQEQKLVEDQRQLLLQQQLNIQELMNTKTKTATSWTFITINHL
jgi:hypothetical protein